MRNRMKQFFIAILSFLLLLSLQPFQILSAEAQEASVGFELKTAEGSSDTTVGNDRLVWLTLSDLPSDKQAENQAEYTLDLPDYVSFTRFDEEQSTGKVDYDAEKRQVVFTFDKGEIHAVFQLRIAAERSSDVFLSAKKIQHGTVFFSTAV